MKELVRELEKTAPDFKEIWRKQEIVTCCGERELNIESVGIVTFEHTTLIIDEERHLRLVYYAALPGKPESERFEEWTRQLFREENDL